MLQVRVFIKPVCEVLIRQNIKSSHGPVNRFLPSRLPMRSGSKWLSTEFCEDHGVLKSFECLVVAWLRIPVMLKMNQVGSLCCKFLQSFLCITKDLEAITNCTYSLDHDFYFLRFRSVFLIVQLVFPRFQMACGPFIAWFGKKRTLLLIFSLFVIWRFIS